MAKFELIPDLTIMGVQGLVFGAAYLVVKTKFVTPYLKLKDKRLLLTEGNKGSAKSIVSECETKAIEIESRISQVIEDTKIFRENEKLQAMKKQEEIVSAASIKAKQEVEKMTSEIKKMLNEEKAKIPDVVKTLNEELYNIAIN